jgi:hypothetical protein
MPFSEKEKIAIIEHALATDAGRTALAQAMVEPVRGWPGGYPDWMVEKENSFDDMEIPDPIDSRFDILDL